MASHGVPRVALQEDKSDDARQRELQEIETYRKLIEEVSTEMAAGEFTPQLLQKTAELLKRNPEYYTIWNYRRRIYAREFDDLNAAVFSGDIKKDEMISNVVDIIQLDLQFLFPLLLKFPKCYWIWNHRLWLLEQSTKLLPHSKSRTFWTEELGLVSKMLARDSRNFLGWGYRRTVVRNLESSKLNGDSMARQELNYTSKMVGSNLSNFSAWHNRSQLILRILNEEKATDKERRKMLDEELALIHKALFDPYDQSLWFYHQNLMCTFDPDMTKQTIITGLSLDDRLKYLAAEREFVEEVLEDVDDCKWVYQALIEIELLEAKTRGVLSESRKQDVAQWLAKLKQLDPLRQGRWNDLKASLIVS